MKKNNKTNLSFMEVMRVEDFCKARKSFLYFGHCEDFPSVKVNSDSFIAQCYIVPLNYYQLEELVDPFNNHKKLSEIATIPNKNIKIKWRIAKEKEAVEILENWMKNDSDAFFEYVGRMFWVNFNSNKNNPKPFHTVVWYDNSKSKNKWCKMTQLNTNKYSAFLIGEIVRVK